jgi:predicted NUDIX family phosphoesterase
MKVEDVMVVETSALRPLIDARTFIRDAAALLRLIDEKIIPYVVVRHGDDVFALTRTAKQSEERLHHKVSIGVGGHINPGHDLLAGLRKELEEEVAVPEPYQLSFAGILNDESTAVSRVHLGAVYELRAPNANVQVRETEKMTGAWMSRAALAGVRERMESWSQIVFDEVLRS